MKVFGLHPARYRGARLASRLDAAAASDIATIREQARRQWRAARRHASMPRKRRRWWESRGQRCRWQRCPAPTSRRPHRHRLPTLRTAALIAAVATLRARYPMWGKRKIATIVLAVLTPAPMP